jgi:hypothetical protein
LWLIHDAPTQKSGPRYYFIMEWPAELETPTTAGLPGGLAAERILSDGPLREFMSIRFFSSRATSGWDRRQS